MVNPVAYLQEVSQELNKVSWPDRDKTLNMTILVIVVSLVFAGYIAGLDFVFQQLLNTIL